MLARRTHRTPATRSESTLMTINRSIPRPREEPPLRVVFVVDWFLKYATKQAAAQARAGAEVTLVCRDHAHEFAGDFGERDAALSEARRSHVEILELPGRFRDPRGLAALPRLRRELRRRRPDVVHLHEHNDPRASAILPRALRVMTVHDPTPHPGQERTGSRISQVFLRYPERAWRRWPQLVVLHSDHLVHDFDREPGQVVVVVPHGLDVREEPLAPPTTAAVGFFGRYEPYKGLDVLARAMRRVWEVRPDVRLRMAGQGDTELPLQDARIDRVAGYLPEQEIDRFFAGVSVMALPYTQASQSGAGSLAIGRGVPAVVSRLGGLPDLVLDDSYVAQPGDDARFAEALVAHLDDDESVRRRIIDDVAGPRSWDAVASLTLGEYAHALQRLGERS